MPYGFGFSQGGYTVAQYGPVVLSSGRRKHLNLLIEDQCQENAKTYGWEHPATGFSLGLSKQRARTAPAVPSGLQQDSGSPRVNWGRETASPPVSEALAAKVGNKRTPSGNFFGTINSALVEKVPPPNFYAAEDMTHTAAAAMKEGRGRLHAQHEAMPSPLSQYSSYNDYDNGEQPSSPSAATAPVYQFSSASARESSSVHQAAMGPSSSQRSAAWLMPWQTGDRMTGRRMADAVRSKRTPSGNFSVLALAKANK